MNSLHARLKLAILALGVLLLSLTPYPRAFSEAMGQAEVYSAAREYGAALNAYREAARHDPQSPLPWLRMGEVLLNQHRFVEAKDAFREAERRGAGVEAVLGLGESCAGRGDWAMAIKTGLRAQALAPDDARVYVALGRGTMAQGQFDLAASYLSQALELASDDEAAAAHALLGRLLIGDDPIEAREHFYQAGDDDMLAVLDAATAEPDPARRALLLGISFLQRDELPVARHHFERAVTLAPGDASAAAHAYLGHTLDRMGETAAAQDALEQAATLDPDSVLAYYFLGVHHRLVGNAEEAQAALWEALLRDPENAALRVEMAEAFLDLHDYVNAEEWYQGAVEVAPENIEFQLSLAHFYTDRLYRIGEGGVPAAEAAIALAPADARAHDVLGWAYYLEGRRAEAEVALSRALSLDPNLVSAHFHIGSLYANSGRLNLARHHLQRAIDLDTEGYYRSRAEALLHEFE